MLPKQMSKLVPTSHLMSEEEWRSLGVQQSQGWIHYMIHKPGSCVLPARDLFQTAVSDL
ncbi:CKS1 protein, partial [Atractosteus spatula]|nr:CKS1 protein [Atractosteus spatula]